MSSTTFADLIESLPRRGGAVLAPPPGGGSALEAADLDARSRDLAATLSEYGFSPGARAAVISGELPHVLVSVLAILRAGGVPVPLDRGLSADDLLAALRGSEARYVLVADEACLAVVLALRADLPAVDLLLLFHAPSAGRAAALTVADAIRTGARLREQRPGGDDGLVRMDRDSTVLLPFVPSGGVRRLLPASASAVAAGARTFVERLAVGRAETVLAGLPASEPAALVLALACLGQGARIALLPQGSDLAEGLRGACPDLLLLRSDRLLALRDRIRSTVGADRFLSGAAFRLALAEGRRRAAPGLAVGRLPSDRTWRWRLAEAVSLRRIRKLTGGRLRALVALGKPMNPEEGRFFLDAGISLLEGATAPQAWGLIAVNRPEAIRPGTVGKPVPDIEIRSAPDGRIEISGPMVSGPGWVRTEWIGGLDPDGYVVLRGKS